MNDDQAHRPAGRIFWALVVVAGMIAGVTAACAFFAAHAVLIAPIWASMPVGVAIAGAGGVAFSWAFAELLRSGRARPKFIYGITFGALLWAALLPMTVFAAMLRALGWRDAVGSAEVPIEIALAVLPAACVGGVLTHGWRGGVACAAAALVAVLLMGGPVPLHGAVGPVLFSSFLLIYSMACGAMASTMCYLSKHWLLPNARAPNLRT